MDREYKVRELGDKGGGEVYAQGGRGKVVEVGTGRRRKER